MQVHQQLALIMLLERVLPILQTVIGGQFGKNLVINGANVCTLAQRGSSSTSSGYQTVDRFKVQHSWKTDEAPTQIFTSRCS